MNGYEYRIEIVDHDTYEVVKTLRVHGLRHAHKTEDGMNRNLNHSRYFTRIIAETSDEGAAP